MNWLRAYFSIPFKALAVLVRIYQVNRAWLEERLARKHAAIWLKNFLIVTLVAWFAVWLFAGDDNRLNLNRALKSMWSEIGK